jgi:hypothetical protein
MLKRVEHEIICHKKFQNIQKFCHLSSLHIININADGKMGMDKSAYLRRNLSDKRACISWIVE